MKKTAIFLFLISLFFYSCEQEVKIKLMNPLNSARADEIIILKKEKIGELITLKHGLLPVFKNEKNELFPSQLDDLNNDGIWDEAVLLVNFAATETLEITVALVAAAEYPEFEKRTNLSLKIKQEDGSYKEFENYKALPCSDGFEVIAMAESVSWENDKMAFRNYFDCRNVKDLFGKLLPGMILDKIGTSELGSYHELSDWGMDILHCGSSLGSGGIALLRNDSLFRLGSTDVYEYQKIVEGPVRSIFELRYSGWEVAGEKLEAVERITIYPGKYWFESDVTVKGSKEGDQVVTGIVTSQLKHEPFAMETPGFQCIGTHDIQSLNNDELGMAVIVPLPELGKIGRTSDINFFKLGYETVVPKKFSHIISETYYIGQKCVNNVPAKHYFFSVWGLEKEQWKNEDGFRNYIAEESVKLSHPISVL